MKIKETKEELREILKQVDKLAISELQAHAVKAFILTAHQLGRVEMSEEIVERLKENTREN